MVSKTMIGYMRMNTYRPPENAEWGMFNDRIVSRKHVKSLAQEFLGNMDSMADATTMWVIVRKDWIENYQEVKDKGLTAIGSIDDFLPKHEVPEIKFTKLGLEQTKGKNLWVTSGNHRRIAQRLALDRKMKMLTQKKDEERRLREAWTKAGQKDEGTGKTLDNMAAYIRELEEKHERQSLWGIRLYDKGERRRPASGGTG